MRCPIIFSLAIILSLPIPQKLLAEDFLCAHLSAPAHNPLSKNVAAKSAQPNANSTRAALVLFAKYRDELPGQIQAPAWVKDLFDRGKPGSFSHFYETMSFQRHRIAGQAYPQRYVSSEPAASYLATDTDKFGRFGQFSREILQQADRDINFARFDNDGPDGAPNSGDDDGIVDVVFIVTASAPTNIALYAEDVFWIVPRSHRRVNSEAENHQLSQDGRVPLTDGMAVELGAGDAVVYTHMLLHWGSHYSTKMRRTMHPGYRPIHFGKAMPNVHWRHWQPGFYHHLSPTARQQFETWDQLYLEEFDRFAALFHAIVEGDADAFSTHFATLHASPHAPLVSLVMLTKMADDMPTDFTIKDFIASWNGGAV